MRHGMDASHNSSRWQRHALLLQDMPSALQGIQGCVVLRMSRTIGLRARGMWLRCALIGPCATEHHSLRMCEQVCLCACIMQRCLFVHGHAMQQRCNTCTFCCFCTHRPGGVALPTLGGKCMHTLANAHTHKHAHTRKCAYTCKHSHAHTHTHTLCIRTPLVCPQTKKRGCARPFGHTQSRDTTTSTAFTKSPDPRVSAGVQRLRGAAATPALPLQPRHPSVAATSLVAPPP